MLASIPWSPYVPQWMKNRCLKGECPLHSGMSDTRKKIVLKACVEMKSYDDSDRSQIVLALRCPSDKHDPLYMKMD